MPPSSHPPKRRRNRSKPAESTPSDPSGQRASDPARPDRPTRSRNQAIDGLRGLAIGMMVIDHGCGLIGGWGITESNTRVAMRLSMPLFALLFGYFFRPGAVRLGGESLAGSRWMQIGLAAVLVNALFYPAYQCLDILASFFLVMVIGHRAGPVFAWLVVAAFAYPIDPTDGWPNGGWMDFPLTIVLGFAALGNLYANVSRTWAWVAAAVLTAFYPVAQAWTPGSVSPLLFLFVLPAMGLLALAERFPGTNIPGLTTLGRHPLKAYVIQYYVIFGIAR